MLFLRYLSSLYIYVYLHDIVYAEISRIDG